MKNINNSLAPLAALVLFSACLIGILGFLVVFVTSFGFGEGMAFFYFQKLKLPEISIALPVIGMILFAVILLGLKGEITAAEYAKDRLESEEEKREEGQLKAA